MSITKDRIHPLTTPLQPHNYIIHTTLAEKALKYAHPSKYRALISDHHSAGHQASTSSLSISMAYGSTCPLPIARLPSSSL